LTDYIGNKYVESPALSFASRPVCSVSVSIRPRYFGAAFLAIRRDRMSSRWPIRGRAGPFSAASGDPYVYSWPRRGCPAECISAFGRFLVVGNSWPDRRASREPRGFEQPPYLTFGVFAFGVSLVHFRRCMACLNFQ